MADVVSVRPAADLYRLARGIDPFAPPDWDRADIDDGTFGNRFDDPTAQNGKPPEKRFRAIYCATQRVTAFGETLARFRISLSLLAQLDMIDDDETTEEALAGAIDPEDRSRGLVTADWRFKRRIGFTTLAPELMFADIGALDSMQYLRTELAPLAERYEIGDVDLSALTSQKRSFTQRCARHIYDLSDGFGRARFAGIRYVSRLSSDWECWAIYDDRFQHESGFPDNIAAADPDLIAIARTFRLTIEVITGMGSYLRP